MVGLWTDTNGDCTFSGEVSVPELLIDNAISLSPYPTNHSLTIQFKDQTLGPQEIQIIDYGGRIVKRQVVQSQNTIDVSELSPGIYIVITENRTVEEIHKNLDEGRETRVERRETRV